MGLFRAELARKLQQSALDRIVDSWPKHPRLKLSFGNSNNVNSLYTSFWSWLIETLISLQKDLKAGNVTVHNPPLLKLEISSGLCVFKFMLSSFPALRMAMACWLSIELTLQYSCAGFAKHDHSHIVAQPLSVNSCMDSLLAEDFFWVCYRSVRHLGCQ